MARGIGSFMKKLPAITKAPAKKPASSGGIAGMLAKANASAQSLASKAKASAANAKLAAKGPLGAQMAAGQGYRAKAFGVESPEFVSQLNPSTGKFATSGFEAGLGAAGKQMLSESRMVGNSPWLQMQTKELARQEKGALGDVAATAANQAAQARAGLAMRGGLTSGSRERLGSEALRSRMLGRQDVANQYSGLRSSAQMQAEQNRQQQLGTVAGMEGSMSQFNVGNRLQEMGIGRQQAMDAWRTQAGATGAAVNAGAMRAAGGSGSVWDQFPGTKIINQGTNALAKIGGW